MSSLKQVKTPVAASLTVLALIAAAVAGISLMPNDTTVRHPQTTPAIFTMHVGEQVNQTNLYFTGLRYASEPSVDSGAPIPYAYFTPNRTFTLPLDYSEPFLFPGGFAVNLRPEVIPIFSVILKSSNSSYAVSVMYQVQTWDFSAQTISVAYVGERHYPFPLHPAPHSPMNP
jgi:hypothetical protein